MASKKDIKIEVPEPRTIGKEDILGIAIDVLADDISQNFGSPDPSLGDHARSLASSYFSHDEIARERVPELFEEEGDLMSVVHDELIRIAAQEGLNSSIKADRDRITQLFRESPLYSSLRKIANLP